MIKALVTGATGFTGQYMVQNLLDNGYEVRVLVRASSNLNALKNKRVELCFGDICNIDEVEKAVEGVDVIYHIAALYRAANVPDSVYYNVNVTGTKNLLDAALKYNIKRFLHCSTVGIYGHIENPPADETAPLRPGDIYQDTKLEGEKLALSYYKEKGLPVTIVRPTGIYGPGDLRMLKMYKMIQNGKFIMFGKGDVFYHLTFVTDVVEGFRLAAESEKAIGKDYIIAGDECFTLEEFKETVAKVLNVKSSNLHLPVMPLYFLGYICEKICIPLRIQPPIFRRRVDLFVKSRSFDAAKAKRDFGFQPKIGVMEGIKKTAEWYSQNGYLNQINKD